MAKHNTAGFIYYLIESESKIPFYVGETIDHARRLREHQACGRRNANLLVYKHIHRLNANNVAWEMVIMDTYSAANGPEDLENDHIIKLIQSGFKLKNQKKGNSNWMAEMQNAARVMKKHKIPTYKKYKEWCEEQVQKETDEWQAAIAKVEARKPARVVENQKRVFDFMRKHTDEIKEKRMKKQLRAAKRLENKVKRERELKESRARQEREWRESQND